jgi:ferrous iron transport protein B
MNLFSKLIAPFKPSGSCCGPKAECTYATAQRKVAIVGNPNVGKSVLFNCLTGAYATVSNYPGTSVEVTRGKFNLHGAEIEVVDTPGMYSLLPVTEEERVARNILVQEKPDVVMHVVDAKNLERMLPFTLQLLEAGLPVILVLNIMDEAEKLGMRIDPLYLENSLKIPVLATVLTTGRGLDELKMRLSAPVSISEGPLSIPPDDPLEKQVQVLENLLQGNYGLAKRAIGLLLLQGDEEIASLVKTRDAKNAEAIMVLVRSAQSEDSQPLTYRIALHRQVQTNRIVGEMMSIPSRPELPLREKLSRMMINPLTGLPILILILYYGIYQFVGKFGAGFLVDAIENGFFEKVVNPWITQLFTAWVPWKLIQELFVGDYGIITLGVRYAVALILPIVTTFFIAFAVIEDTGYLPRLGLLIDRLFKKIGLTGRAVIPMVLGLGCDTMATMVTRTLPTKRERLISTILLALAVPCSAQLGVILALLAGHPTGLWVWLVVLCLVFLMVGFLSSRVLPGEPPLFYMEVPPLRLPKLSNVLVKTYSRVKWYFAEIFPMFIAASFLIWLGRLTGIFDMLAKLLESPVRWIGLPPQASVAFLFGFFRRDYGVAGLYDLKSAGLLNGNQIVVASVTLTLFLPCIAQFLMNVKERGWKTGVAISVFVLLFSVSVGYLVNLCLNGLGVML